MVTFAHHPRAVLSSRRRGRREKTTEAIMEHIDEAEDVVEEWRHALTDVSEAVRRADGREHGREAE